MNRSTDRNDVVILQLDRPRELRLSHKVLKAFLAENGIGMDGFDRLVATYDGTTKLLYAMLRREEPDMTPERCDDLLDMAPLGTVMSAVQKAVEAAFGEMNESGEAGETDPTAKTKD